MHPYDPTKYATFNVPDNAAYAPTYKYPKQTANKAAVEYTLTAAVDTAVDAAVNATI